MDIGKPIEMNMNVGKLTSLFDSNCIIDQDIGLMNLVIRDYNDPNVFDLDDDYYVLMSKVYFRKDPNPLVAFAKPEIDKETLQDYYEEFIETKSDQIIELSISTEIPNLLRVIKDNDADIPYIMYRSQKEKEQLSKIAMIADMEKIPYREAVVRQREFGQFFFRDASTINEFLDTRITATRYYIANRYLNFDEEGNLIDKKLEENMVEHRVSLNSFNMYNEMIVNKEKAGYGGNEE